MGKLLSRQRCYKYSKTVDNATSLWVDFVIILIKIDYHCICTLCNQLFFDVSLYSSYWDAPSWIANLCKRDSSKIKTLLSRSSFLRSKSCGMFLTRKAFDINIPLKLLQYKNRCKDLFSIIHYRGYFQVLWGNCTNLQSNTCDAFIFVYFIGQFLMS